MGSYLKLTELKTFTYKTVPFECSVHSICAEQEPIIHFQLNSTVQNTFTQLEEVLTEAKSNNLAICENVSPTPPYPTLRRVMIPPTAGGDIWFKRETMSWNPLLPLIQHVLYIVMISHLYDQTPVKKNTAFEITPVKKKFCLYRIYNILFT